MVVPLEIAIKKRAVLAGLLSVVTRGDYNSVNCYDVYYCCPVNTSNSMNIKKFEWYKPHSLDDSPERG